MNRKEFLKSACGLGVCGCVLSVLDPSDVVAASPAQAPDQRLAFARYQVAKMVGFMAAETAAPACAQILQWSAARADGFLPNGSSSFTFRKSNGMWSVPRRVSQIPARFPSLSPDGKYLFFCGDDGDIYWADRTILDPLRPAS